jgi:iron complex outermembrane recepter protein
MSSWRNTIEGETMNNASWRGRALSAGASAMLAAAPAAFAQDNSAANAPARGAQEGTSAADDQLEDVIVTAQRRSQRLQDVPISVTAVSADALERANISNVADVTRLVPALVLTQGISTMVPYLRGVGTVSTTPGNEPSVPVYIDGVYYARIPQGLLEFNNIERVEVLKGPQGTLFGRNATGGLVQIVTRDPSAAPAVKLSAGYANYDTTSGSLYATSGFGERVQGDLALSYEHQGEGWGHNINTGQDVFKGEHFAARTKWNIELSPSTVLKLAGDFVHTDTSIGLIGAPLVGTNMGNPTGAPAVFPALDNFYDLQATANPWEKDNIFGVSARLEQDLGAAQLVSISSFRKGYAEVFNDTDYLPINWSDSNNNNNFEQISQELQLTSGPGKNLEWVGGLYFLRSIDGAVVHNGGISANNTLARFYGEQYVSSYAAYGQATYHLTDKTSLTGGARYTYDDVAAQGQNDTLAATGTTFGPRRTTSTTFKKPTWKVALDHKFTDDFMAYGSVSRGYKAGVFPTILFSPVPVNPEVLDAYEIGFKSEAGHRLRFNAAAFLNNASNLQLSARNGATVILFNATDARMKGVDFDGELLITPGLSMTFGASWLDAKFRNFPNAPATRQNADLANGTIPVPQCSVLPTVNANPANGGNVGFCTSNATGNYVSRAPKVSGNVGLSYDLATGSGAWRFASDLSYSDGFYWFVDNAQKQRPYALLGASIRYTLPSGKQWISAWGKNLTDREYYLYVQENQGTLGYPSSPAAPRQFGFTFGTEF